MHIPVLLKEVVEALNIKPHGRYIDGTLGLGGHAEAILKQLGSKGRLLGLDVDPSHLTSVENRLQPLGNLITRQINFRGLQEALRDVEWEQADGMIFDLGISSAQLDDGDRGLSFQGNGPLDMRLDPRSPLTLEKLLSTLEEQKLERALTEFGEGQYARRISRGLLEAFGRGEVRTVKDIADFCARVIRRRGRTHPATRVFLALRCLVNDELGALNQLLNAAPPLLTVGGRLAIISFHSLEDRMVKQRFRALASGGSYRLVNKKPIVPSHEEETTNPRSRSAKLRLLERVA